MTKNISIVLFLIISAFQPITGYKALAQELPSVATLFIGGGALPEEMYQEFLKLTGTDAKLVVIPTATGSEIDEAKIKVRWQTRGFSNVSILHTRDRDIAVKPEFTEPLRQATAVWFSGGSQQRIADAYLGTQVEDEIYRLLQRGGVVGGSSAGAAIMTRKMISGGKEEPELTTGFALLPNAILDQHFLRRSRLARLSAAVQANPELTGYGIDEATAIVVANGAYKVVGSSYVIRIRSISGTLRLDAYENGEVIPLEDY